MSKEDIRERRIENLKSTQSARKEEALKKVYKAIDLLQKLNEKVNFQTVAKAANVSVSYLYKYPEIKQYIGELRSQQSSLFRNPDNKSISSKSHSQIVSRLKDRIHHLEEDNTELRRKNEALAGQVYRVHLLQEQVERQEKTIEELQNRLRDFSKDKSVSKVTPINSKLKTVISEEVIAELESLGIPLNATLSKKIQGSTEEAVLKAIEALKDQLTRGDIRNPGGWLAKAIEESWAASETLYKQSSDSPPQTFISTKQEKEELVPLEKLKALSNLFKDKDE